MFYLSILIYFSGVDSCNGDSGGPLAYRLSPGDPWYIVGIISYGKSKCGDASVFVKVPNFVDWIKKNIKEKYVFLSLKQNG